MNDLTAAQLGMRRAAELAATFMIGDGLLGLLQPGRHVALWRSDVGAVDLLVPPSPTTRRAAGCMACCRSAQVWFLRRQ